MKLLARNIFFIAALIQIAKTLENEGNDASLFEINDMSSNEEDTYKMIEQMQHVSPEDQVQDDEINEIELMDRNILEEQVHAQQYDNDDIPEEIDQQDDDDDEEEIEEGEDDIPFDFKNHDDTEFFDHLPILPNEDPIDDDEDDDNNAKDDADDESEEEDIYDKPMLNIPQESKVEASIPWIRPSHYGDIDTSSFYQDENATRVIEKSRFKVWHSISVLVIFVLIYKCYLAKKKKGGLNEKDFLPLHNNKSKYYKSEIKNC